MLKLSYSDEYQNTINPKLSYSDKYQRSNQSKLSYPKRYQRFIQPSLALQKNIKHSSSPMKDRINLETYRCLGVTHGLAKLDCFYCARPQCLCPAMIKLSGCGCFIDRGWSVKDRRKLNYLFTFHLSFSHLSVD